jgi:hypothetical protein
MCAGKKKHEKGLLVTAISSMVGREESYQEVGEMVKFGVSIIIPTSIK